MYIKAGELNAAHTGMDYSYTYEVDQGKGEITPVKSGFFKMKKIVQVPSGTEITDFSGTRKFDKNELLFIRTDWVVVKQSSTLDSQDSIAYTDSGPHQ